MNKYFSFIIKDNQSNLKQMFPAYVQLMLIGLFIKFYFTIKPCYYKCFKTTKIEALNIVIEYYNLKIQLT